MCVIGLQLAYKSSLRRLMRSFRTRIRDDLEILLRNRAAPNASQSVSKVPTGSIALVITAIGPVGTFDTDWDSVIAKELLDCAVKISNRLGFSSKAPHKAA